MKQCSNRQRRRERRGFEHGGSRALFAGHGEHSSSAWPRPLISTFNVAGLWPSISADSRPLALISRFLFGRVFPARKGSAVPANGGLDENSIFADDFVCRSRETSRLTHQRDTAIRTRHQMLARHVPFRHYAGKQTPTKWSTRIQLDTSL